MSKFQWRNVPTKINVKLDPDHPLDHLNKHNAKILRQLKNKREWEMVAECIGVKKDDGADYASASWNKKSKIEVVQLIADHLVQIGKNEEYLIEMMNNAQNATIADRRMVNQKLTQNNETNTVNATVTTIPPPVNFPPSFTNNNSTNRTQPTIVNAFNSAKSAANIFTPQSADITPAPMTPANALSGQSKMDISDISSGLDQSAFALSEDTPAAAQGATEPTAPPFTPSTTTTTSMSSNGNVLSQKEQPNEEQLNQRSRKRRRTEMSMDEPVRCHSSPPQSGSRSVFMGKHFFPHTPARNRDTARLGVSRATPSYMSRLRSTPRGNMGPMKFDHATDLKTYEDMIDTLAVQVGKVGDAVLTFDQKLTFVQQEVEAVHNTMDENGNAISSMKTMQRMRDGQIDNRLIELSRDQHTTYDRMQQQLEQLNKSLHALSAQLQGQTNGQGAAGAPRFGSGNVSGTPGMAMHSQSAQSEHSVNPSGFTQSKTDEVCMTNRWAQAPKGQTASTGTAVQQQGSWSTNQPMNQQQQQTVSAWSMNQQQQQQHTVTPHGNEQRPQQSTWSTAQNVAAPPQGQQQQSGRRVTSFNHSVGTTQLRKETKTLSPTTVERMKYDVRDPSTYIYVGNTDPTYAAMDEWHQYKELEHLMAATAIPDGHFSQTSDGGFIYKQMNLQNTRGWQVKFISQSCRDAAVVAVKAAARGLKGWTAIYPYKNAEQLAAFWESKGKRKYNKRS